ncbi:hypothetical protein D3C87_1658680 [compost metagenome]
MQRGVFAAPVRVDIDGHRNASRRSELDGVAHQVQDNLLDAHRIAHELFGYAARDAQIERQPLVAGARREDVQYLVQQLMQ